MDRRLLDYNPESETFEAGAITRDESEWRGATDTQAVFGEADEMELAAELLEVANEAGLERFLGDLIDRGGQAVGRVAPTAVRGAITSMLKTAARRSLPIIGRAIGERGGAADGAISARVVDAAARYFGLELEGLSPEDQEFEAARRFIRFAGEAAKNAVAAPAAMPPEAAMAWAARRYAPGLLKQPLDPRPADPGARRIPAAGGRWVRRGQNIVVNGF